MKIRTYPLLPLVSIIIPIYNSKRYLHKCIGSLIRQDYKNFEVILVDNGSTDNSGEICNAYALSDNRIKVTRTQSNNGPGAARNIGIENSRGDLICFIDSDDFIEANALNLLIENYNLYNADIIVGNFNNIRSDNSRPKDNTIFLSSRLLKKPDIIDYTRQYLKKPNRFPLFAHSWGRLFKLSIIKDHNILFNTDLRTFEDVAFNFDYLKYTEEVFFLKESVYNHLIHENYTSATMMLRDNPKDLFGYKQALVNISNFIKSCNPVVDIKKEVGHADVCLTIIQLVRTCGQINGSNKQKIYQLTYEIINDPCFRENLRFYSPSKGDSRILPILMMLKLVWPVILVCKYKAHKRYKKKVLSNEFYPKPI